MNNLKPSFVVISFSLVLLVLSISLIIQATNINKYKSHQMKMETSLSDKIAELDNKIESLGILSYFIEDRLSRLDSEYFTNKKDTLDWYTAYYDVFGKVGCYSIYKWKNDVVKISTNSLGPDGSWKLSFIVHPKNNPPRFLASMGSNLTNQGFTVILTKNGSFALWVGDKRNYIFTNNFFWYDTNVKAW